MARSHDSKSVGRRRRYLAYGIPLLALAIATGVLLVYLLPPSVNPAMDYQFQLLIQISNSNSSQLRAIAPQLSVGEAGGFWRTIRYNSYGISGHYPLYMDTPSPTSCPSYCNIHVKSLIVHNYTLGDYFEVWGQPLGANNTIGIPQGQVRGFVWEMCLGLGSGATSNDQWGAFVLQPSLDITLFYHNSTGLGCAPS